jgi:hypothetical protein
VSSMMLTADWSASSPTVSGPSAGSAPGPFGPIPDAMTPYAAAFLWRLFKDASTNHSTFEDNIEPLL